MSLSTLMFTTLNPHVPYVSSPIRHPSLDLELAQAAVECLSLMGRRGEWMRSWAMFDVLPVTHTHPLNMT